MEDYITFFKDDKNYKSPTNNEIKKSLKKIGINIQHHCLIRKKIYLIVNNKNTLNLKASKSDSKLETIIKNKILSGSKSITLEV